MISPTPGPARSVTVNDTQPPSVVCPANITATLLHPADTTVAVTYSTPAATDNCPGATVVCAPASGSLFSQGVTTVTCTATDASGNHGTCGFTVTVPVLLDTCVQDDVTGDSIQFNSVTGAYKFTRCSTGLTLSGTGVITHPNGVLTLTDTKPDRRVTAGYNTSQHTGTATIMIINGGVAQTIKINMAHTGHTCACAVH